MAQAVTDQTFEEEVIKSDLPVLVDFWAEWCGPCKMIAPIVEELADDYEGRLKVVKLDTDENPETPMQMGIMGIPTLILFKDGEAIDRIVGAAPKRRFTKMLDAHI
ncbi:MAG: thioredoxin [Chloroflexi bacterium]|nr:thioredoxin [Chloroflexota bacterium]